MWLNFILKLFHLFRMITNYLIMRGKALYFSFQIASNFTKFCLSNFQFRSQKLFFQFISILNRCKTRSLLFCYLIDNFHSNMIFTHFLTWISWIVLAWIIILSFLLFTIEYKKLTKVLEFFFSSASSLQ